MPTINAQCPVCGHVEPMPGTNAGRAWHCPVCNERAVVPCSSPVATKVNADLVEAVRQIKKSTPRPAPQETPILFENVDGCAYLLGAICSFALGAGALVVAAQPGQASVSWVGISLLCIGVVLLRCIGPNERRLRAEAYAKKVCRNIDNCQGLDVDAVIKKLGEPHGFVVNGSQTRYTWLVPGRKYVLLFEGRICQGLIESSPR